MSIEDFRAAAYVANVNAGHVGSYLETAQSERGTEMETENSATEKKPDNYLVFVSAGIYAHSLTKSLNLAYWIRDTDYHKQRAISDYNMITQIMREGGMIP